MTTNNDLETKVSETEEQPVKPTLSLRKRPARLMPYSMNENPEHEGAVSLVRSGGVATDWEFRQLCERFPEKVVAGIKDLLKTERGQQIAALLKREIADGSE